MGVKEDRQTFYKSFHIAKKIIEESIEHTDVYRYIFAIDQGLGCTGYARYNIHKKIPNSKKFFYTKSISSKHKQRFAKINEIKNTLVDAIDENVLLLLIENYAFGFRMNQSIMTSIAELGGVIRYGLSTFHVPILQVSPKQIKKYGTGNASADKNIILREVYKRYKHEAKNDDEADALILADIGRKFCRWLLNESYESDDDSYLKKKLSVIPECFSSKHKIFQYQFEVLKTLIMNQGDKLTQFWF